MLREAYFEIFMRSDTRACPQRLASNRMDWPMQKTFPRISNNNINKCQIPMENNNGSSSITQAHHKSAKWFEIKKTPDQIWDVPKMRNQHGKVLRSNTRAWLCVDTWTSIHLFIFTVFSSGIPQVRSPRLSYSKPSDCWLTSQLKFEIFLRPDTRTCPQRLAINNVDWTLQKIFPKIPINNNNKKNRNKNNH